MKNDKIETKYTLIYSGEAEGIHQRGKFVMESFRVKGSENLYLDVPNL